MDQLSQNIRLAFRSLRRSPTFTTTAVIVLGLGIGMAVAMWTVFDAVLLRRTPVVSPERVVLPRALNQAGADLALAHNEVEIFRHSSRALREISVFEHFGAYNIPKLDGDRPLPLEGTEVDGHFFDVLGVRPVLGRLLRPDDDSTSYVMVLSYEAWQRYFGGDPSVIGRHFRQPQIKKVYTVVGVAPPGIDFPAGTDYWEPLAFDGLLDDIVGRLAPGATLATARSEFLDINKQIDRQRPGAPHNVTSADIRTFTDAVVGNVRPALLVLLAAVGLLLVIACINVGNLLLLRAAGRSREIAVRRALGASYGDIVRQLLLEAAALGIMGGVLGLLVAEGARRILVAAAPSGLPRLDAIRLSGLPFGAAAAMVLLATALSGVLPAVTAAHRNPASPLKLDERSGSGGRDRRRVRQMLVASQIALALILLSGAGLLTRSLRRLESIDLGFRAHHLSVVTVMWPIDKYGDTPQLVSLADRLVRRIGGLPGVTAITPIIIPPFYGPNFFGIDWQADWQSPNEAKNNPAIPLEIGGADYFHTFETPILRGRGFLSGDVENSEKVAVVSQSVAHRYWPGQDPIGKRLRFLSDSEPWRTVVGVAGESRFRAFRDATPMVYLPYSQFFWQGYFAIRTTTDLGRLVPSIRRAIVETDPTLTLWNARTVDDYLSTPLAQPRLDALLLSGFGLAALVLAAIGLYGVMASAVREQTREIGVRMALGAGPARLRREVLRRALAVALTGAGAGFLASLIAGRFVASLLYDVSPADPLVLSAAAALLLVVACLAAYLPAHRATRIEPAAALRSE
jgi:putative ABC transport system permease protein